MAKSIIREIIIMLLLCVAIVLIIGILFYDYIPSNKVIPAKETYETPENVKEEINEQITEMEKTEISYEITDADLNIYKQSQSYKPGKKDPFALQEEVANTNNSTTTGSTSTSGTDNNKASGETTEEQTPEKDADSTGTFFNEEGIK